MTIGSTLRDARKRAGLTQAGLAAMMGIKPQFMNDIERGHRNFPTKYLPKLPSEIRGQVIDAALAELKDQADKLEQMR
jgi:transcriptional regulator with XRE-family HTH domain